MAAEIAEQPGIFERILASSCQGWDRVCEQVRQAEPRFVLLAARGSSDHAALYAKYLIETELGIPAGMASTSAYTIYDADIRLDNVLWIAISQSGSSPDLVEATKAARRGGATTLAVTNATDSPLAQAAHLLLDLHAGPERAVAATKTYTASLLTLWLFIARWGQLTLQPAHRIPGLAADALTSGRIEPVALRYRFAARLLTTSRGYSYATAREAALKLMETCYVQAQAFSGADLLHGPIAMVDNEEPVLAVVPDGAGGRALAPVLTRLCERGADLCVIGNLDVPAAEHVPVPGGLPESLAPILQILPLQLLVHQMSLSRGYDPDQPRGLSKVTHTH